MKKQVLVKYPRHELHMVITALCPSDRILHNGEIGEQRY